MLTVQHTARVGDGRPGAGEGGSRLWMPVLAFLSARRSNTTVTHTQPCSMKLMGTILQRGSPRLGEGSKSGGPGFGVRVGLGQGEPGFGVGGGSGSGGSRVS